MELIELIKQYKEIKQAMEDLSTQLSDAREEILKACGNKEYEGNGLKITKVTPEPTFEWRIAMQVLKIPMSKLQPFFKEKDPFFRLTIKRSIDI